MSQAVASPEKTFTAGAAIAKYARVKLSSGKLAAAGLGEVGIGTLRDEAFADGDLRTVLLHNPVGTRKMIAAGAIVKHAAVYGAAAGKVDDAANGKLVGIALETAGADGDIIEVWNGGMHSVAAAAHITNPTDLASSITAINAILVALENHGITLSA